MPYSQEEINAAITLAEEVARNETELDILGSVRASELKTINDNVLAAGGNLFSKLTNNSLAQALLPQARNIMKMRKARADAIGCTAFGELTLALSVEGNKKNGETIDDEDDELPRFSDEHNNLDWFEFLGCLHQGDQAMAFYHLNSLLAGVKLALVNTELPPVAPQYEISQ